VRLIFASPTYGPVEPAARNSQFAAIMRAAGNGVTWVGNACPDKMKFDVARNTIASEAMGAGDVDGIFWCDSDIILPTDAVRLAAHGKDFVTGFYYQKAPPFWPLVGNQIAKGSGFSWLVEWPENALIPADGCGFGCVYTSIAMLRKMDYPLFEYTDTISEDLYFCVKAKKLGYQLWADTAVQCGHLPQPEQITREHFQKMKPNLEEFVKAQAQRRLSGAA
jgi:hypothetical protein